MTVVMKNTITWHCPFFHFSALWSVTTLLLFLWKQTTKKIAAVRRPPFYCANTQNFAAFVKNCVCHWSRVLFVLNYFPHRTLLKCEAFMDHTMTWFLLTSSCVCVKKTRFGRQMHQCFFLVFAHEARSIPNISMKIKWKLPFAVLPILSIFCGKIEKNSIELATLAPLFKLIIVLVV